MEYGKVLIVIPCLNEINYIEQLVKQLVANTSNLKSIIVIVDGGSTDGTVEVAKRLDTEFDQVKYLHNPGKIQSAAVNIAVRTFGEGCEFLIRLDAHSDYPNDYCKILLEEQRHTQADSIVVAMNTIGVTEFQKAIAVAQNSKLGNGGSAHRVTGEGGQAGKWVDHGHHALISIAAFNKITGYDESFSHNEDAELDIRLVKSGFKIWLTRKTQLDYYPRSNIQSLFRQYENFGRGRLKTIKKHKILPKIRQVLPAMVLPSAIFACFAFINIIFAIPLIVWLTMCLIVGILLSIKHDTQLLQPTLAIITMHIAWSKGFIFQLLTD